MQIANFEKRIVAFIDILGFKEHIVLKEKTEELLKILYEIRKINSSHQTNISQPNPGHHIIQIIPDVSSYSDNIIISAPTAPLCSAPFYFDTVLSFIVHLIREIQISNLFNGIALRGAISFGDVHFDGKNNVIVGSPLIETIDDEMRLAKYPRVILSKSLLEFIAKERNTTLHGLYNDPIHTLSDFRVDFDGLFFLDFFKLLVITPNNINNPYSYFKQVKTQIEINIKNNQDKLHVVSKWYWLANYFDISVQIWEKINAGYKIDKFNLGKNNYEHFTS